MTGRCGRWRCGPTGGCWPWLGTRGCTCWTAAASPASPCRPPRSCAGTTSTSGGGYLGISTISKHEHISTFGPVISFCDTLGDIVACTRAPGQDQTRSSVQLYLIMFHGDVTSPRLLSRVELVPEFSIHLDTAQPIQWQLWGDEVTV